MAPNRRQGLKIISWWPVLFWLFVWQLGSMALRQNILLVSPISVLIRLGELVLTPDFWLSILFSMGRILAGFLLGCAAGVLLAGLSVRFIRIKELLAPVMLTMKAVPVASFIILVLLWVSSKNLSILISFLMVLPVIYTNVQNGIYAADPKLLEMAKVFGVSHRRTVRYIYASQVLPFFRSACSIALGLSWKAGIAAEVIGIPDGSIGEKLYKAKIFLDTPDLFAWTVVIVVVSLIFEKVFLALLDYAVKHIERM